MDAKKNPRYNIISMRVSDEEKAELLLLAKQRGVSMSSLMSKMYQEYKAFFIAVPHEG